MIEGGAASRANSDLEQEGAFVPLTSDAGQILFAASRRGSDAQSLSYA